MAEQAELADSNMANYGGEEHRSAAKAAAQTEKEYIGAGTKPGLEIWRVENRRTESDTPDFGIKRWPKDQYGEFYDGDSYIVLNTYKVKDPETGKLTDALAWDVHFWLGKDTSIDERGVAAYKTVELDDLLDDGPVQHRETMNNESPLFQSYFRSGIQYLSGGIESGFRKVEPEKYEPRLLEVRRTKRTTKARQVPCNVSSMNKGDCYILDMGPKVYKYLGPESSAFEKSSAANLAANIVGGRQGKSKAANIDDDNDFWETVGGTEADVADAMDADAKRAQQSDADKALAKNEVKVFQISDASGAITFTPLEPANDNGYTTAQLDPNDVFVVDSGIEIFIWRGSGATKQEKSQAWKLVDKYIEDNGRPATLPVTVIDEGKINVVFKSSFVF